MAGVLRQRVLEGAVRLIGWVLAGLGVLGMGWLIWQDRGVAKVYLFGTPGPQEEAAYCLAVAERISEITRGQGDPGMEAHLDEQIGFWRSRAGSALGAGRAALGRDSNAPGINEQAHLHEAVQDCGLKAIGFYGHRFPSLEVAGS